MPENTTGEIDEEGFERRQAHQQSLGTRAEHQKTEQTLEEMKKINSTIDTGMVWTADLKAETETIIKGVKEDCYVFISSCEIYVSTNFSSSGTAIVKLRF